MLVLVMIGLVSVFAGCSTAIQKPNVATPTLNLNDPNVRHLKEPCQGSSVGVRLFFLGGSPSENAASKRAQASARIEAVKEGVDPTILNFMNMHSDASWVPLLVLNFKTITVSYDAYYDIRQNVNHPPVLPAPVPAPAPTPITQQGTPAVSPTIVSGK